MKRFILNIALFLSIILIYNSFNPIIGLYKLHRDFPFPALGTIKIIDLKKSTEKNTLVIGCSNLQHNIQFDSVQNNTPFDVDFLYFPGSQNSTFLQYVFDEGLTAGYKRIILYAPFHILSKNNVMNFDVYNYTSVGNYEYARNTILHSPANFFYNWSGYYDSVRKHNKPFRPSDFVTSADPYIDSLSFKPTQYRNCNSSFNKATHTIYVPNYSKTDVAFIENIKGSDQSLYILFTPIPDFPKNRKNLLHSNVLRAGFENMLNRPELLDTSLFYNQWYHLNSCGRKLETEKMIRVLKSLH